MKRVVLIGGVLLLAGRLNASSGTEGAAFLDIPVGAGPAALGSAYTALATNAYAPVYNPAGLGLLTGNEVSAQHLSYLESIHYEYLSVVHPLPSSNGAVKRGVGFSVQYLGSGDIAGTDENGTSIGDFSSHYAAYNLSYGQTFNDKLSFGVTGKWINAKIADVSANAFAADLGAMYRATDQWTLATTLTNLGSKLKFLSEGDDLPMALHLASAYKISRQWMATGEGIFRKNGLASGHIGTEWRPMEAIALRAGYKTDTLDGLGAAAGVTAGIGVYVWGQEMSYAFSPYGDLGNAQYLSMLVHFGESSETRRNLIQYQNIHRHQTVRKNRAQDGDEPEYQQLMQLLSSDDDSHLAEVPHRAMEKE